MMLINPEISFPNIVLKIWGGYREEEYILHMVLKKRQVENEMSHSLDDVASFH